MSVLGSPTRDLGAFSLIAILVVLSCAGAAQQSAPANESSTRDLWDSNLLSKRPAGKKKLPRTQEDSLVGVTLWRLRPSKPTDEPGVRSLIHEEDERGEWTPERIQADTSLHEGDRVRISIETARTGYLYVVDCDEYADGTRSEPHLIFPTLRLGGGNNAVGAGTVIEIPGAEDAPPYFKMRRTRPSQTSELLTIIVTARQIESLAIGTKPLVLTDAQVASWKKEWKSTSTRLEAAGTAGAAYTLTEKIAGSGHKVLTQDDPLPQTMYHLDAKPGQPLLVELPLQVSK